MATDVFNIRGSASLGVTNQEFIASSFTSQTLADSHVLYEVPAGKRAKVITRLHSYGTGAISDPLSCRVYAYSYSSGTATRATAQGSLRIGSLNLVNISAATVWSTSSVSNSTNYSFMPSLHVTDYMIGDDVNHPVRDQLSETSVIAAFGKYIPTTYYLAEGETIDFSYSTTGYANAASGKRVMWNAIFLVYYDFDIIEEDAV